VKNGSPNFDQAVAFFDQVKHDPGQSSAY
jgi:hypothetical protein